MSFSMQEKIGVIDLLQTNRQNISVLFQLAKSVTKNVIDIPTEQEALNTLFLHIPDILTLLNKRLITKQILIKYLHKNEVPLTVDVTKAQLVNKIIHYWYKNKHADVTNSSLNNKDTLTANAYIQPDYNGTVLQDTSVSHTFAEDFWSDASLVLQISANDGIDEQICEDSNSLLQSLQEARQLFGFYFNPNLTHGGVQGRMDVHGLVLVLACGTLHTVKDCVGVFECIFGLLRDPFAENNWKSKNIKLILRSKGAPSMPSLEESDTLRKVLELPVPHGELT